MGNAIFNVLSLMTKRLLHKCLCFIEFIEPSGGRR